MKKIIALCVGFLAFAGVTFADDYNYLTIQKTDGTEQSFTAQGLILTFQGSSMIATEGTTTATFALSDLNKMFFSAEATGIKDVTSAAVPDTPVAIYDVSGVRLGSWKTLDEARGQLKKGVYVVRQNGETKKIAVE